MLTAVERKELLQLRKDPMVKLGRQADREKQELYRLRMLRKKGIEYAKVKGEVK